MASTLASLNFTVLDWAIVALYLALILGLGFYVNRFTGSVGNYLVAGRNVRMGLLIATFIGTELGLVTIVYASQMGFESGLAGLHVPALAMLVCMFIGLTGVVVYRLRAAGVMTIPEYYQTRYGTKTRILGGVILVLAGVLNMGMFLRAGAEFIGGLTGLSDGTGLDFYVKLIMTILLVIVFAYTILGGMISVILTDYLQFTLLGVGFLVITIFALSDIGWDGAVDAVAEHSVRMEQREIDQQAAEAIERLLEASEGAAALAPDTVEPTAELAADADAIAPALAPGSLNVAASHWSNALATLREQLEALADEALTTEQRAKLDELGEQVDEVAARADRLAALAERGEAADPASPDDAAALAEQARQTAELTGELAALSHDAADAADELVAALGREPDPQAAFDPLKSPVFGWTYVLWMSLVLFAGVALWQPVTIRALVAVNPRVAAKVYFWSAIGFLVRFVIPCFWGACALAFVMHNGDYERFFPSNPEAEAVSSLAATGMYLGQLLPPVLLGLIAAALLASFMSTHDSYLMAWSSSLVQDVIAPLRGRRGVSEKARILLTRVFIFLIGCFLLIWGLWYEIEGQLWDYMAITGTVYFAGAFAVVVGGLYWSRASSVGAVLAMLAGLLALMGIVPREAVAETLAAWMEDAGPIVHGVLATVDGFVQWPAWEPRFLGPSVFILAIAGMVIGSLLFPDRPAADATDATDAPAGATR